MQEACYFTEVNSGKHNHPGSSSPSYFLAPEIELPWRLPETGLLVSCSCTPLPQERWMFHTHTEWLRLAVSSGGRLVQPPAQAWPPKADCLGLCPEKETPQPLGNLCQCSVQKSFLIFKMNPLRSSLCPLHLVLTVGTTERSLA